MISNDLCRVITGNTTRIMFTTNAALRTKKSKLTSAPRCGNDKPCRFAVFTPPLHASLSSHGQRRIPRLYRPMQYLPHFWPPLILMCSTHTQSAERLYIIERSTTPMRGNFDIHADRSSRSLLYCSACGSLTVPLEMMTRHSRGPNIYVR